MPQESDWRSHYELGEEPRRFEIRNALTHFGVSMFDRPENARRLAQRWPRLGLFIAEIELGGELGIWFAETGSVGHFTVWGRPTELQRCVRLPTVPV
jgi:hypothetical protein